MKAIIFKENHRATQQGKNALHKWCLEYRDMPSAIDPVTGWTSSFNTTKQIHLTFETLDEALSYAERNHIEYDLIKPKENSNPPKSYSNNFT